MTVRLKSLADAPLVYGYLIDEAIFMLDKFKDKALHIWYETGFECNSIYSEQSRRKQFTNYMRLLRNATIPHPRSTFARQYMLFLDVTADQRYRARIVPRTLTVNDFSDVLAPDKKSIDSRRNPFLN